MTTLLNDAQWSLVPAAGIDEILEPRLAEGDHCHRCVARTVPVAHGLCGLVICRPSVPTTRAGSATAPSPWGLGTSLPGVGRGERIGRRSSLPTVFRHDPQGPAEP
jgi:hypothetical protein